jgi:hypothetical protein
MHEVDNVARLLYVMAGLRPGHLSPHVPRQITGSVPGDDAAEHGELPYATWHRRVYFGAFGAEPEQDVKRATSRQHENC